MSALVNNLQLLNFVVLVKSRKLRVFEHLRTCRLLQEAIEAVVDLFNHLVVDPFDSWQVCVSFHGQGLFVSVGVVRKRGPR